MAPNPGQILIIGEQLRIRMHEEPGLVGDRRYHFRTYAGCVVGKEVVDWLLKAREATSRDNAVKCMRLLQDNGVLHHVCDDHIFKDEYLFYKFRVDDGSIFVEPELEVYCKGIMLHQSIRSSKDCIISSNTDTCLKYPGSFLGNHLVTWMIDNKIAKDRAEGVDSGDQLLKAGIIRNVQGGLEFLDEDSHYQFVFDMRPCLPVYKSLGIDSGNDPYADKLLADAVERLGLSPGQHTYLQRLWSGKNEAVFSDDKSSTSSSADSETSKGSYLKPVVLRHMSSDELVGRNSPYVPTNVRIVSDSVGFGFVVRGDGPCYVQTVDPNGPAASVGLKVRQYIKSVNGRNALAMNHKELAKEIMKGPVVDLVVMVHFRSISAE
eukprot:gene4750-5374_t